MSEEQSFSLKRSQRNFPQESCKDAVELDSADSPTSPSVEETMEVVKKQLKEKRQQLGLPENIKVPSPCITPTVDLLKQPGSANLV